MMDEQYSNQQKRQKLSQRARLVYAFVFIIITAGFALLWATATGYLNLSPILGVCGFKQRFAIPCPGCGWTHAAEAFVTGHFVEAFMTQPAGAVFAFIAALTAVFSLLFSVFGIDFGVPKMILSSASLKILLITAAAVILAGWITTVARTIFENTHI